MRAVLLATGSYLPARVVKNDELARMFPTSDAWIRERIGIRERRFAALGEGPSDMAKTAAEKALVAAGLKPKDLDAIVFATATPEHHAPGSGALLQTKLGCRNIPAFDVRNTSPGFLFALELADGLIRSGRYRNVLVAGSEVHSTGLDFSERGRTMAVIFGDGCGVFLLGATEGGAGFQDFVLHTDGTHAKELWCEGPGSLPATRPSPEGLAAGTYFPSMNGKLVFEHAVNDLVGATDELLARNLMKPDDADLFVCHQANLRILEAVRARLNVTEERLPHNIDRCGNLSSAAIPVLYDELLHGGCIRPGMRVVLASFGSGFSWGAGLLRT